MTPIVLRDPNRTASQSIRGYLYQVLVTALRWFELGDREVLICEGNEDLDKAILSENGSLRVLNEEQIKHLDKSITIANKAAHESIFNFLVGFVAHHRNGANPQFILTTNSSPGAQHTAGAIDIDVIRTWCALETSQRQSTAKLVATIKQVAEKSRPVKESHTIIQRNSGTRSATWMPLTTGGWHS